MGKVAYFVRAQLKTSDRVKEAAEKFGLPAEVQRFAVVDAFVATERQRACLHSDMAAQLQWSQKKGWLYAPAKALIDQRIFTHPQDCLTLLKSVQAASSVLGIDAKSVVKLKNPHSRSGEDELTRLAIPVTSQYEDWYRKPGGTVASRDKDGSIANWGVHPLVWIDPRRAKATASFPEDRPSTVGNAVQKSKDTLAYFVHTYSKTNMWAC